MVLVCAAAATELCRPSCLASTIFILGLCCSLPSPQNLRQRFKNLKAHVPCDVQNKGFSGMYLLIVYISFFGLEYFKIYFSFCW